VPALFTETDPRVLVPGDADQVIEVASRIRVLADQGLRPVIGGLDRAGSTGWFGWSGAAADSAHGRLRAQRSFWSAQADILDSLATAFDRYAVAIRAAQTSAARAAQSAAWARAAFPYPAAWTAYVQAATDLRDAQVRLGEAADLLADAVERATDALPDGETDADWQGLGRGALQIADELAAIVAGGLLAAVGLGDEAGTGALPVTAAVLPEVALPEVALPASALLHGRDPVPDAATVADLLTPRLRLAGLPQGGPSWDEIADLTWAEVKQRARSEAHFKIVRKLLERVRWDG
jgi:hypothetical protein